MTPTPSRLWWLAALLRQRILRFDPVSGARIRPAPVTVAGRGYGAWKIPGVVIRPGMLVYAAGVGLDTTFDEDLVRRHGAVVHAFDPTPRAIGHGRALEARLPGFHFHPVGLWKEDAELVFHAPANPLHVSHSITGLHGENPGFKGLCRRVRTLMNELGHDTIDLLKMDIEGAEYEVLADLLDSAIPVRAVCVEFDETHSARDGAWRDRIAAMTARMIRAGFDLVAVQPKGNYTFLRREA